MKKKVLHMNDFDVSEKPLIYTCYGLGSCIGLFLTDRRLNLSGGAHIPIPFSLGGGGFLDASHMIEELMNRFVYMGSDLGNLRAKLTGGAQVYVSSISIGHQNTQVVMSQLIQKRIFIAASDVGGSISRTARFNTLTGELEISTSEKKTYSI